jgi:CheY-like chemotaxis protein
VATRILLVDDDLQILPLLQKGLAYEGFEVYTAVDGESGLAAAKEYQPHIVLLDIAMPGLDGFEVCRRLRLQDDIAIIMLTARDEVTDKVSALNLGADDYVPKPFAFDELVARIRAVLRRHKAGGEPLVYADLELDQAIREVRRASDRIDRPGVQSPGVVHAPPQAGIEPGADPGTRLGIPHRDRQPRVGSVHWSSAPEARGTRRGSPDPDDPRLWLCVEGVSSCTFARA